MDYKKNHKWQNWAQTLQFQPDLFCQPETVDDVVQLVKDARAKKKCVRVQGAEHSHSWSQFVATNDVLVSLDNLAKPLIADVLKNRYTIQAGVRLKDLVQILAKDNLGLKNLGSIMEQSIAGATATGTHGTGLRLGNLATQIVGMKVVTGTGDVKTIDETDMKTLRAARVNFGALGIVVEVTLDCVKNYDLEFSAYWCELDDVLDKIDVLNQENDRMRIWWTPKPLFGMKHDTIISTMNTPGTPRGILKDFENLTPDQESRLAHNSLPLDLDVLFTMIGEIAVDPNRKVLLSRYTGNYVQVLTIPLLPILHRECEYAIPVENTRDALVHLRRIMQEGDFGTTLPVEVRFVAKDDTLLSPVSGRDACYIGVNTMNNANELFQRWEPLAKSLQGRPHWGKHFTMTRSEMESMYPGYAEFAALRAAWDPDNVFANSLISDLFD
jgi:L-gulono-1,4-lactone dehydrogenase